MIVPININGTPNWTPRMKRWGQLQKTSLHVWLKTRLERHHVRPSRAKNLSQPMLVLKDDGTWRTVIDYKPLNAITIPEGYPTPNILETLQHMSQYNWFAEIDIHDAFSHLSLVEKDKYLTAFDTPWGAYEFNRMPQGWNNAPAFWQHHIRNVLQGLWWDHVISYVDNILVYAHTKQECHYYVRQVHKRLQAASLLVNDSKSKAPAQKLHTLGYTVTHDRIKPSTDQNSILHWVRPRTKHELQVLLGTLECWRPFTPNLATSLRPLQRCLQNFDWGAAQTKAFQDTKKAISAAVHVASSKNKGDLELYTDASDYALGGVLKEKTRILAVISRSLSNAEERYSTTDREMLAVVWALDALQHFTLGAKMIRIHTDHLNLVQSLMPSTTNHRRNRWIERLGYYRLQWAHIKGTVNPADLPSRIRTE